MTKTWRDHLEERDAFRYAAHLSPYDHVLARREREARRRRITTSQQQVVTLMRNRRRATGVIVRAPGMWSVS